MELNAKVALERVRRFVERRRRLDKLLYLRLTFKPLYEVSYVHIASEREAAYIPVFKVGGEPYIPITSIYGALRSVAECVAKASLNAFEDLDRTVLEAHCELEEEGVRHICSSYGSSYVSFVKSLVDEVSRDQSIYRHFFTDEAMAEIRSLVSSIGDKPREIPRSVEPLLASLCPICRLFGGPGTKSSVEVLNVRIASRGIHVATRVSIERPISVARPGHLYTLEELALDKLEVELLVKNIEPGTSEAKTLRAVIDFLKSVGISIGGHKSVGLGKIVLDANESVGIYVELDRLDEPEKLVQALVAIDKLPHQNIDKVLRVLSVA